MSSILVVLQFICLFVLILPLYPPRFLEVGVVLIVAGALVGMAALRENIPGNFNIRPDIKKDAVLVTSGIYRYIRHPMYTSTLLMMLGFVVIYMQWVQWSFYAVLMVTIVIKAGYEERLWKKQERRYKEYMKNSKRFLPFVY